jgi:tetratricopeptide (TPR) repeat protein
MTGAAGSFVGLQTLATSFTSRSRRGREAIERAVHLGGVAIPLCLREIRSADEDRRDWARQLLLAIADAPPLRARIVASLRASTSSPEPLDDEAKVAALALLAELGEPQATASFRDPRAIQRRSLGELAELLTCRSDVALAADLAVTQLDGDALLELIDSLAHTAPGRTRHLVDELLLRTDLDPALRSELVLVAAPLALVAREPLADPPRRAPRVIVLGHPNGRTVAIVLRRDDDHWRCLVALVDPAGHLCDALYREDAAPRAVRDELIAPLLLDGFVPTRCRFAAVRTKIATAARRTVTDRLELPGAYFLGRDLLGLGDAHQPDWRDRWEPDLPTTLLGRATDLLSTGEVERARPLLERCVDLVPDDADAAAGYGLCLLGNGDLAGARLQLERAVALDPACALHHWNLAAVAHRQGSLGACYLALRRYVALERGQDADAAARLALAGHFVADHERLVRLEHPGVDAVDLARREVRSRSRSRPSRSAPGTERSRTRTPAARRPRR